MKPIQIFAVLILALSACAPKAIIVQPIAPLATKAHEQAKAALESSKRVTTATESIHAQAGSIAAEVGKAFAEVDRLKKLPSSSPDEFATITAQMIALQSQADLHNAAAGELNESQKATEKMQAVAVETQGQAVVESVKTDAAVSTLQVEKAKSDSDATKWRTLKVIFWIGCGVVAALSLALLYLRYFA